MRIASIIGLLAWLLGAPGCEEVIERPDEVENLRVTFVGSNDLGGLDSPRTFSTDRNKPDVFFVDIEAMRRGQLDTTFHGWVALTVRPEVVSCAKVLTPDPPAVKLTAGVARNVKVEVINAYCTVRIVAVAEGFVPGPTGQSTACNNGVDDDLDGYIDQDDLGCYRLPGGTKAFYASDNTETGGNGASGASPPIHFRCPTLFDIQQPVLGVTGNESPLRTCRALVDRGWLLVTRVGVDGLYVTDFEGVKWDGSKNNWSFNPEVLSYDSVFIYNYSTPLNLQEGDCLTQIDGTVEEFYGFTEMNKPTWKKGDFAFCAAKARMAGLSSCPTRNQDIDSPAGKDCRAKVEKLVNSPVDLTTLLLKDAQGVDRSVWDQGQLMTERFESAIIKLSNVEMFTEARRCDKDGDNIINFSLDDEKKCSNDCGDDKKCIVRETYNQYNQWTVHFKDGLGNEQEVSVVTAGSILDFDPIKASEAAGKAGTPRVLKEVVGTLRQLIFGRPPWTMETRRPNDCPECVNK